MKDRINLWTPNDPDGYGAFDEEQLMERTEDTKEELCEDCDLPLDECLCYSPCCGADMRKGNSDASFGDYGICPDCKEHI